MTSRRKLERHWRRWLRWSSSPIYLRTKATGGMLRTYNKIARARDKALDSLTGEG